MRANSRPDAGAHLAPLSSKYTWTPVLIPHTPATGNDHPSEEQQPPVNAPQQLDWDLQLRPIVRLQVIPELVQTMQRGAVLLPARIAYPQRTFKDQTLADQTSIAINNVFRVQAHVQFPGQAFRLIVKILYCRRQLCYLRVRVLKQYKNTALWATFHVPATDRSSWATVYSRRACSRMPSMAALTSRAITFASASKENRKK